MRLNDKPIAKDGAYIYAEAADGSQVKISKADLAAVVAEQMYHGPIKTLSDFNNATKQGTYYYSGGNTEEIGTSNFGVIIVFTSEPYISQIMVGPLFSWRTSYDNGQNWTSWNTVIA